MAIRLPRFLAPRERPTREAGDGRLRSWEWPLAALVALLAVLWLGRAPLDTPYWWDAAAVYVPGSQWVRDHAFAAFPGVFPSLLARGHTTLFYVITAGAFSLFGDAPAVGHAVVLLFSVMTLVYTYALGTLLFGRLAGAAGALLAAVAPLYLTISSMVLPEIPLTALTMACLYEWARGRHVSAAVFGVLVVLTKETGLACACAVLGATALWSWRERRVRGRALALGGLAPMVALGAFFVWQRVAEGWWVLPFHAELFGQEHDYLWSGVSTFHSMALADGRAIAVFAALLVGGLRLYRDRETFGPFTPGPGAPPRWAIASALALVFLANQVFFTKMWFLERYALPAHPCLTVLLAGALLPRVWEEAKAYAAVGLVAVAATAAVAIDRAEAGEGYASGETTFRYLHMVEAHREIFRDLEARAEPPLILSTWPISSELRDPTLGWVERPYEVVGITGYLDGTDEVRGDRPIEAIVSAHGIGDHEDLMRVAEELGMRRTRRAVVRGAVVDLYELSGASRARR